MPYAALEQKHLDAPSFASKAQRSGGSEQAHDHLRRQSSLQVAGRQRYRNRPDVSLQSLDSGFAEFQPGWMVLQGDSSCEPHARGSIVSFNKCAPHLDFSELLDGLLDTAILYKTLV
jgi:hypothetical protein